MFNGMLDKCIEKMPVGIVWLIIVLFSIFIWYWIIKLILFISS